MKFTFNPIGTGKWHLQRDQEPCLYDSMDFEVGCNSISLMAGRWLPTSGGGGAHKIVMYCIRIHDYRKVKRGCFLRMNVNSND